MLTAIIDGRILIKNFDFGGQKYKREDAVALLSQLQHERSEIETSLSAADQKIIAWFLKACNEADREQLRSQYNELFLLTAQTENDLGVHGQMMECLAPLYQTMSFELIEQAVAKLKDKEAVFKKQLERVLNDVSYPTFIDEEQRKTASEYLSRDWQYFIAQTYAQDCLDRLNASLYVYFNALNQRLLEAKARLLKQQLEMTALEFKQNLVLSQ